MLLAVRGIISGGFLRIGISKRIGNGAGNVAFIADHHRDQISSGDIGAERLSYCRRTSVNNIGIVLDPSTGH